MAPAARWGAGALVLLMALVIVAGLLRFAFGWLGAAGEVAGPGNVKTQYSAVIEGWNALEAAAANACGASADAGEQGPTFLEDPAFAYQAQYRRIAIDYNRRQANIFEARLVGPKGYPASAPSLAEMQRRVCP